MSSSDPITRRIPRRIQVNSAQQATKFCTNEISTCKYNAFTFLPRFLLEQFRRYSNIFFLVIALLQQIPHVSPTGRYTTAVPFLIILAVSALKEIFEDIKRRRMDIRVNNYKVRVLRRGRWETVKWQDLKVGEVVKIEDGHGFPADLVLLASSEPQGMAYIETSSLDGETNLKIRQALSETAELVGTDQLNAFSAVIECEPPNKQVSDFNGKIIVGDTQRPLGINQLLLRGAMLKNTRWIFGVIVYTGHDAKLLMNAKTPPLKKSNIDILTNHRIVFLFFILLVLALASAVGAEIYNRFFLDDAHYLPEVSGSSFAWNALTFFILYNNLIPISLQVTLELVRFFQASYINCDILMYDEATDTPANARTSNLNEELGQVKFLMTDKTGTLTRNVMKFKRCCIEGKTYGNDDFEEFKDDSLTEDLRTGPSADRIREFLTVMAVCHTVVPENTEDGEINYQASSPDEGALVRGAASQGFVFHTRTPQTVTIRAGDKDERYEILNVLEFSSDRKRMGVVVKDESGAINLYIKGADNKIFERLSQGQEELVEQTQQHLEEFAHKGYRTLCFAMTKVDSSFYEKWSKEFHEASIALENREKRLSDAAEKIEKDLTLVGASAIEDKLQDYVPETIRTLMAADIRVWMLTGDKRETAINIAQSSALCTQHTQLLILDKDSYDDVFAKLQSFADTSRRYVESRIEFALVINGSALHHAMGGEARCLFAELCWNCRAVICCRMTPMQKAEVVELVKATVKSVVLAIGDGANDVAMIQAANVGVGITGEEGLRAASASDYSIAQFHFLLRLLLVHGTWNYHRSVKVILYSFYKNICLYIIELWFAFFSGFSGQTIFERWTIAMFNVIFTAWPPIILGLFDRPVSAKMIFLHPSIYHSLQKYAFSNYQFTLWIVISLWHSLLLFFLTYGFLHHEVIWANGRVGGWLILGNAAYTYVVATVSLKALLECDAWTWVVVFFCLGSIVTWFVFLLFYSAIWGWGIPFGSDMSGMATMMMSSWTFWFGLVFIPITTLLTDIVVKGTQTNFFPSPRERICLLEKRNRHSDEAAFGTSRKESAGIAVGLDEEAAQHDPLRRGSTGHPNVPSDSEASEKRSLTNSPAHGDDYGSTSSRAPLPDLIQEHQPHAIESLPLGNGRYEPLVIPCRATAASAPSYGAYLNSAVSVTTNDDAFSNSRRMSTLERARLIRSTIGRRPSSSIALEEQAINGYAFSQEEDGAVAQTELIRNYDSTHSKPDGV